MGAGESDESLEAPARGHSPVLDCFAAMLVPKLLGEEPIYDRLRVMTLERDAAERG